MTTRTYPQGVPSWIDVEQPDPDAAAAFYGGLLGWTFTRVTPEDAPVTYLVAALDGHDVAGVGGPGTGGPGWSTYVAVDDAEEVCRRWEAAGGRVVQQPQPAGEGGVAAVCADPSGHELRLWQARRRLGAQLTNAPGTWNFSDLHTTDADAATAFYREVLGWEVEDLGYALMVRQPGYGDHLASTVDPGIHERQDGIGAPPGFADAIAWFARVDDPAAAGWKVTFTVDDRDAAADRARELGGEVLGTDDTDWTRTALVRDPQGATFTLSEFTPPGG
jgi:predicted enzyme related to lactoylglutathione lyase